MPEKKNNSTKPKKANKTEKKNTTNKNVTKGKTEKAKTNKKNTTRKRKQDVMYVYVHKWLEDNKVPQKYISLWEKDESKFNKNIKQYSKKIHNSMFKDPNKPKRPLTGYMIYSGEIRSKIKEENPDADFQTISVEIGKSWRALSDKQKEVYKKKSEKLKKEYNKKMESYVPPEGSNFKKVDKNKPKKALSSYIFFSLDKRKEIVEKNPNINGKEVLSKVGKIWNEMKDSEKAKYVKKAEEDKKRYAREMEEYEKKNNKNNKTKTEKTTKGKGKGKRKEPEEEPEEEEEEDEEPEEEPEEEEEEPGEEDEEPEEDEDELN